MSKRVRSNAFDEDRTDRADEPTQPAQEAVPLDGLLTRVAPAPHPRTRQATTQAGAQTKVPAVNKQTTKPRGAGGRPTAETPDPARVTPIAARIPGHIYEAALPLVKGVGKPSWGQLVTWTIQDHPDEVNAKVIALSEEAVAPRRLRGQNREGEATMQVTARVLPAELTVLDQVRGAVNATDGPRATRTMVIVAALTVANNNQEHPPAGE